MTARHMSRRDQTARIPNNGRMTFRSRRRRPPHRRADGGEGDGGLESGQPTGGFSKTRQDDRPTLAEEASTTTWLSAPALSAKPRKSARQYLRSQDSR